MLKDEDFRKEYEDPNFKEGVDSNANRYYEVKYPVKNGFGFRGYLYDSFIYQCDVCHEAEEIRAFVPDSLIIDNLDTYLSKYVEPFRQEHILKHWFEWELSQSPLHNESHGVRRSF